MKSRESLDYFDYAQDGKWQMAINLLTAEINQEPNNAAHYDNRAICNLAIGRLDEALRDFRKGYELLPEADAGPIMIGVVLWWLAERGSAVEMWETALSAAYTDAAGGVTAPALLLFASLRLASKSLEKKAVSILRKRWEPSLATRWPGPIAGYLLGRMSEDTFLVNQTFLNPTLEIRRKCNAYFWVAVNHLRCADKEGYRQHLLLASQSSSTEERAVLTLEPEYWLALAELEKPNDMRPN